MRTVLILGLAPTAMLFGWYWLSLADVGSSVGGVLLSRQMNEGVFFLLGHLLGVEPDRVPGMLASGIAFDTALLLGFVMIRRRRAIGRWIALRAGTPGRDGRQEALARSPASSQFPGEDVL
ncbi:DUF6105 family protein [Jiella pelagia]|uniref:DUF6105 family protein n=1 Tax=Jiella pelagia TaxID=2986949 RepID=A0ABY7BZ41_9HYPH|nr:DUF6105 family protein [Jiella pelagia]WAP68742.1 DUF6105 family protein [Jiella pelagia]